MLTRPPFAAGLERGDIAELAELARIDPKTSAALLALLPSIAADAVLGDVALRMSGRLVHSPVGAAISELAALPLEARLGNNITLFYLLVALLEIPAAEDRHRAYGIAPSISQATWAELAVWCHHLRKREGRLGITLEMLAWLQRALNGSLFRVGSMQFELESFAGPVRAYRHRTTGELTLVALPGVSFSQCGRMIAPEAGPGTWTAGGTLEPGTVQGHRIDGVDGRVLHDTVSLSLQTWELVLCEQDTMLRAHIPANTRLSVPDFFRSASDALEFFARVMPDARPKGFYGEGWLFDPQVRRFLPDRSDIDELRGILSFYPGRISELSTLRRFFGHSATRASIVALPRERLSVFQRAVADFLSDPENKLCARGGFVLKDCLTPSIGATRQNEMSLLT